MTARPIARRVELAIDADGYLATLPPQPWPFRLVLLGVTANNGGVYWQLANAGTIFLSWGLSSEIGETIFAPAAGRTSGLLQGQAGDAGPFPDMLIDSRWEVSVAATGITRATAFVEDYPDAPYPFDTLPKRPD